MKKQLDRREFIKTGALGLAVASVGLPKLALPQAGTSDMVVVEGEVVAAMKRALEALGGIKRFLKPGMKVLIKPNIAFPYGPEKGANTDPRLVGAIAQACVDAGAAEVMVAEYSLAPGFLCLMQNGVKQEMAKVKGAQLQYFEDSDFYQETPIPGGKSLKKTKVLKKALAADLIINAPRAKTHGETTVTFGLKNLMGIVYDRKLWHSKYGLEQSIADFSTLIKPQLTIIDASKVMVDKGPGGPGTLVPLNLVIAGVNPVETDGLMTTLTEWYGKKFAPADIKYLKLASELGLGSVDPSTYKYSRLKV